MTRTQAVADAIAPVVGLDPTLVMLVISGLLQVIQACRGPVEPPVALANELEHRPHLIRRRIRHLCLRHDVPPDKWDALTEEILTHCRNPETVRAVCNELAA